MATPLAVVPAATPPALERLVDDYLTSCRARGLSRGSLNAYEHPLRRVFLPWAGAAGITEVAQLSRSTLDRYAAELHDRNPVTGRSLSKDTVHSYLRPLRQLLSWAAEQGETVHARPKMPRLRRRALDVLSLDEIRALEDGAGNERDKLIVRLLADTGMRVGELVQLRVGDVRTKDRRYEIFVQGKGDRDRIIPIAADLHRRVERYATRTRPDDTHTQTLFLGLRRSQLGTYRPLTTSGVEQMVRSVGERAGIRDAKLRCHPHMLRHSFVTNMLREGMNPMIVKDFAGHTSLRMIDQVYAHLTVNDAHDALMRILAARSNER